MNQNNHKKNSDGGMDDVKTGTIASSVNSDIPDNEWSGQPGRATKRNLAICGSLKLDDLLLRKLTAAGWSVSRAKDAGATVALLASGEFRVGLVLVDTHAEPAQLAELSRVLAENGSILWVALTPDCVDNRGAVCRLIATYCHDYHTLPVDPDKLLYTLGHAWGMYRIGSVLQRPGPDAAGVKGMIGNSEPMRQLYRDLRKVAGSDAPVLLTGESGTGKELTARTIHRLSSRHTKPFIAVNCAALPATLIQSELFGHEKGAFTGASQRRIGRFEAADGGTIFLDEIGDLPLELQINLLRFLEENVIERLGSTNEIPVNARVIAATHENLEALVEQGLFREDLFYRLNVLQIRVPSLRDRAGDIELLARDIFERFSREHRCRARGFSGRALQAMTQHHWPGNVRELINRIRRAMVMSENLLISPADLGLAECSEWQPVASLSESCMEAARQAITTTLRHTRNNMSQAARELGISRTTLYRMVDKFSIRV